MAEAQSFRAARSGRHPRAAQQFDDAQQAAADPRNGIDIFDGNSLLEYLDSASFLARVLQYDTPTGWLPPDTHRRLDDVLQLTGTQRRAAAGALAEQLTTHSIVIAHGHVVQPELFAPTLGCRVFTPVNDDGVDLASIRRTALR